MELKRVVVTGLGALTPIGNSVPEYWNALLNGVSGAKPVALFDASKHKTQFACEVKGFKPEEHFDRKEARKMDRFTQYGVVAAREAIKDSGLNTETENLDRIGVIYGVGIGGLTYYEEQTAEFYAGDGTPMINPFLIPKMISNIVGGHISIEYGFHGPNFVCASACASSNSALGTAFNLIRLGKADVIISGGAEAPLTPCSLGGFGSMHALSTRNDSPETASRPFCKSRDGFVMGEGAGCLVLEELEHALKRGAKIYAEVAGEGASSDAYHLTASHPEGLGAVIVMKSALEDAGMQPSDIDYINAHGTSTPVGDASEVKAIKEVFGEHAYKLNISSTKSMTGHLLGAAGAAEAVATVLAIKNDIVPPTINFTGEEDENIDYKLNFTFNKPQKRSIRAALSNTFGFGGLNAAIIFKKFSN
ncbi:MAG: beta-ketoacyl-ACP synthase II [Paludibacteraceae bacterium]|nr:beta-ketoacyl-ACP synthase II [Paludibacteraceae bacterium]